MSSYGNGLQRAARMARDMSEKMLDGNLPHVSGAAALQLLAAMLDKLVEHECNQRQVDQ
jgi:hypothetical protein